MNLFLVTAQRLASEEEATFGVITTVERDYSNIIHCSRLLGYSAGGLQFRMVRPPMRALALVTPQSAPYTEKCARLLSELASTQADEVHLGRFSNDPRLRATTIMESLRAGGYDTVILFGRKIQLACQLANQAANERMSLSVALVTCEENAQASVRRRLRKDRKQLVHVVGFDPDDDDDRLRRRFSARLLPDFVI